MKLSKYDYKDLLAIVEGEMTIEDVSKKYGVSVENIHRACIRRGIHLSKKRVRVTLKYKYVSEVTEYDSVYQCAVALGVDSATIKNKIEGKPCRKLSRYKIEYITKEEYTDEQTGERYSIKQSC